MTTLLRHSRNRRANGPQRPGARKAACAVIIAAALYIAGCSDSVDKVKVTGPSSTRAEVTIDGVRCAGCAPRYCYEACPQRAIDELNMNNRYYYVIDPQRCTNCGICITRCPFNAIYWKR